MPTLDCESIDSVYESFEAIFELSRKEIEEVLDDLDLDKYANENPKAYLAADEIVFNHLLSRYKPKNQPAQICWFHATRTHEGNRFERGISTLNEQIDSLWNLLFPLTSLDRKEWDRFRADIETTFPGQDAELYRMKTVNRHQGGPCAFLVREVICYPEEVGSQDYLRSPEIVEDICRCFSVRYGWNLLARFREKTKPCIIKFVDPEPRPNALQSAAYYLHSKHWNTSLSHLMCRVCFDAHGQSIPPDRITTVEFCND